MTGIDCRPRLSDTVSRCFLVCVGFFGGIFGFFCDGGGEIGGVTALAVASVSRRGSPPAADVPRPCLLLPKSDRKAGEERRKGARLQTRPGGSPPKAPAPTKWFKKY